MSNSANCNNFSMDYLVKSEPDEILATSGSLDEGYQSTSSTKSAVMSSSESGFNVDMNNNVSNELNSTFSPALLAKAMDILNRQKSQSFRPFGAFSPVQQRQPDQEIILQGLLTQIRSNMLKMVDNSLAQIEYSLRHQQLDPCTLAGYLGNPDFLQSRTFFPPAPFQEYQVKHATSTPLRNNDRKRPNPEHCEQYDMPQQKELRINDSCLTTDSSAINMSLNSVLNTGHLKKAKQMFMFTRYPNSSLLKKVFSDINFTRSNTSQLIKWFSNFREYLFINIEKYVRQMINEGVTCTEQLPEMNLDNELMQMLVAHYNRSSCIEVPREFVDLVDLTVNKFHAAIVNEEDRNSAWKKPIYKIIVQLEQQLPDHFFRS